MVQITMYPAQPDSPDFELAADISDSETSITFIDLTGILPAPNTLTIRTDDSDTTPETVYYATYTSGNTLTVTRGYGGTVAKSFSAGALACRAHTAFDHNTFRSNILDLDSTVFHKATAGEINALTVKGAPAAADVMLIEDSTGAVFDKKKIAISTLPFQTILTNPVIALTSSFVSGDIITATGTGVQVQDSGILLTALATLASPTFTGTPIAPTAPNGTSTTQIATTAFVQNTIAYLDPLLYKGVIDCSTNPNYPAADAGHTYIISVTGKIGGASGKTATVGDMLICNHDGSPSGDEAAVGTYWNIITVNTGAVIGPASSTDGNLVVFDGTSGKLVKDGGAIPTFGTWAAFTPSVTWGTADPTISSTVARYTQNGKVVNFTASFIISNGNAASSLVVALPVVAPQIANLYHPLIAFKKITSGGSSLMSDPFAYIDYTESTPIIKFSQFGTLPSGYTAELRISGSYEVA